MNKKLVAVYGSLRKRLHNHNYFLQNAEYLGTFKTEPLYSLYSLGSFPGLKLDGNTSVVMEVYAVTDNEAARIDGLEGYREGSNDNDFYDKVIIETPYGNAGVYVYVSDIDDKYLVKSGDWLEHMTVKLDKDLV